MKETRTTEQASHYDHLELMSTAEILHGMNAEDRTVPVAVAEAIPAIEKLVNGIVEPCILSRSRHQRPSGYCRCI